MTVHVGAGLAPGYHSLVFLGTIQISGNGKTMTVALPPPGYFLATSGPRPPGQVRAEVSPPPTVGGLALPLTRVAWTESGVVTFYVHAATACGQGTMRLADFGELHAVAAGPGWDSFVPMVGGGVDQAAGELMWSFGPFPGEAASLRLESTVTVRTCGGNAGPTSGEARWQVELPVR